VAYGIVFWPTASIDDEISVKWPLLGRYMAHSYVPEDSKILVLLWEMILQITGIRVKFV
jgi:hypothetical protein